MIDLSSLPNLIHELPGYRQLDEGLAAGEARHDFLHLPRAARPAMIAALSQTLRRPIVLLVSRPDRLITLYEELPIWAPSARLLTFPDPRPLFYERASWGPRALWQRVAALAALSAGQQPGGSSVSTQPEPVLILASARAAMTRTLNLRDFTTNSRWLQTGSNLKLDRLIGHLLGIGYQPTSLVTEPGQLSHRGGILDLWPPAEQLPVRIELFGDEVDSMRLFEPSSQLSTGPIERVLATPAREGLPRLYQAAWDELLPESDGAGANRRDPFLEFFLPLMNANSTGVFDFFPRGTLVLLEDQTALENAVGELEEQALASREEQVQAGKLPGDFPLPYLTWAEIRDAISQHQVVDLGLTAEAFAIDAPFAEVFAPGPRFGGQVKLLMDYLGTRHHLHESLIVVSRQASRLAELWGETGAPRPLIERLPAEHFPGDLHFLQGNLSEGWVFRHPTRGKIHLLTDAEIFGWGRPRPRPFTRVAVTAPEQVYADLQRGDWVVHVDYGIGRFGGLVERTLDRLPREFLLVEYADGDQLFVPIHQADRITRYVGVDDAPPCPSRLGTQEWERTKSRAREAVEQVARDLLDLYARRMAVRGYAFSKDTGWQRELEASFTYIETEDQLRAIDAVKDGMERDRPMDRLICGDAGYGKTEVALRAAFKAVMDGKQVAMLVPTTVLAQQHFDTFRQRLAPFPVEVEMLSRFRTRSEAETILERLARGEVDIVIGTHRLIQRDVVFKDLGLLIIDEEQRFGVTHKEFLKQMRTEVDVLTLTATPIPRTLYMALTGVRDVSIINTPPEERLPVITYVGPYDPGLIRQAVLRELDRNGQVFFVHNRVQTIDAMRTRLEHLLPEARIAVAHGQVHERELSGVMERFNAADVDVLLSTSIIESGLDIPNANTLIVDRADTFGLAQLYQLRGRVGRGAARGYAYFFRHPRIRPTEEARGRLETIAEHTQLGAGYTIAMRDLEIRGAGDILGTRQHGHIAAVGFHLYTRLLGQAVRRLKGPGAAPEVSAPVELPPVSIELPLPGAIPPEYVPDRDLRLQLYRRMAEVRSLQELQTMALEFGDRFGPVPPEVENLLYQLRVKILAAAADVEAVTMENGQMLLLFQDSDLDREVPDLGTDVRRSKRGLWLSRTTGRDWKQRLLDVLVALRREEDREKARP